jgi:hypothetical protein
MARGPRALSRPARPREGPRQAELGSPEPPRPTQALLELFVLTVQVRRDLRGFGGRADGGRPKRRARYRQRHVHLAFQLRLTLGKDLQVFGHVREVLPHLSPRPFPANNRANLTVLLNGPLREADIVFQVLKDGHDVVDLPASILDASHPLLSARRSMSVVGTAPMFQILLGLVQFVAPVTVFRVDLFHDPGDPLFDFALLPTKTQSHSSLGRRKERVSESNPSLVIGEANGLDAKMDAKEEEDHDPCAEDNLARKLGTAVRTLRDR